MLFDLTTTDDRRGVVVVGVVGELDMATAPRFRRELVRVIDGIDGPPFVVLDLVGVDVLDAVGLGVVLEAVKRTRQRGGDVALSRAEPQVRRDLEITRVIEVLPVHESVDAAVAALAVD